MRALKLILLFVFALLSSLLLTAESAVAESVSLPLRTVKKPSSDLINRTGDPLDVGQAAGMASEGVDLSQLDPAENKMWQKDSYSAVEDLPGAFPAGNSGVKYLSEEAALPFTYMVRVQSRENPDYYYRMSLSRYSHTTLMRAALLRKLGYYIPSPKYYRNLRIFFASEKEKEAFLKSAQESMISDFDSRGWIKENDKKNHSLVFTDALLEPQQSEYFDIHWGYAPNPNNPDQLPAVQRYSRYRAYRALIVPFTLVDVPESINRFSPKLGSILSGNVVLNHPSAESFSSCTYEDARWLVRRLARLKAEDFQEIVKAGAFPAELESLVYAKLMYRAHNALELFNLKDQASWRLPSLEINSSGGIVKNGKVVQEFVPGYPQRFAHGERQSPFEDGDLQRYLTIRGQSAALGTAIANLNQKLDLLKVSDHYANHRQDMVNRIMRHLKEKPMEPLYQKVEMWGGPVGGFSFGATRHVTTGTYFGSSAPIQLVDNVSVSGRLGYFMALDGVPKVGIAGGANVMVMRDYTHVRPLLSVREGTQVPWKDLVIPKFMNKISQVLTSDKPVPSADGKSMRQPLDAFLADLREGEVFTVTDSVALSTYAQLSSSFDVLLGISPLNFMSSVSVSGDGSRAILKQTSFMRTRDGIQVYVRSQKSDALGMALDVNYFVNVMRVRASTKKTDLRTDAFVIDYNPEYADLLNTDAKDQPYVKDFIRTRDRLQPALRALFSDNNTELLYSRFPHKKFEIDHQLITQEMRTKFLAMRVSSFEEDHLLRIRYPRNPEAPELDPKDEEITLFSNKKGELKGRDLLGLAFDMAEGLLARFSPQARVDLARSEDPNPANSPFGKAYWKTVNTEADVTVKGKQLPTVSIVQYVWGGWNLERKRFLDLITSIQRDLHGIKGMNYRLIEPEAFHNVKAVDFYRITANLSILPKGVERIRNLVLQPQMNGKEAPRSQVLGGFFQRISEGISGQKARANDKVMFDAILTLMGGGNLKKGEALFKQQCQEEVKRAPRSLTQEERDWYQNPPEINPVYIKGTSYPCMVPWMRKLIDYSYSYPENKMLQAQWMTRVIYLLDEKLSKPTLLQYLGQDNYVFFVRINGFRSGDEDGDLEYFSNTLGDPKQDLDYASGLISMFANKTRISPIELDRSQGSFR